MAPDSKHLGVILNNDINNLLNASRGKETTADDYRRSIEALLMGRPGVLAYNVGLPDPVIYSSNVATAWDKYIVEVSLQTWPKEDPRTIRSGAEREAGAFRSLVSDRADPLSLAAEVCRRRGVQIVASYRMNAEDWYRNTWMLSDFGRAHPDGRIPGTGALDPAVPAVFEHRRRIFREVAENYDIDGIEFDYMRWTHMISNPRENHAILTKEVAGTRAMLDEVARRKGRRRLLLGARVGYSLDGPPAGRSDFSCKDLGLDVRSWIERRLVDYICPSYFWGYLPAMPRTSEFVKLAAGSATGVYPTVFPYSKWQADPGKRLIAETDRAAMKRFRDDILRDALQGYADGADGISTFNWVHHQQPGFVHNPMREDWGLGSKKVQMQVHLWLGDPAALRRMLESELDL